MKNRDKLIELIHAEGDAAFEGDVYPVPWIDYSGNSTITGWSSFTNKLLYYKKIDNLVYITFFIDGTSNGNTATFTLPFSANEITHPYQEIIRSMDNDTYQSCFLNLNSDSNVASFHKDITSDIPNNWATSGVKSIYGKFDYEAA